MLSQFSPIWRKSRLYSVLFSSFRYLLAPRPQIFMFLAKQYCALFGIGEIWRGRITLQLPLPLNLGTDHCVMIFSCPCRSRLFPTQHVVDIAANSNITNRPINTGVQEKNVAFSCHHARDSRSEYTGTPWSCQNWARAGASTCCQAIYPP